MYVCLLLLQLNYEKKNKLNILKNKILTSLSPVSQGKEKDLPSSTKVEGAKINIESIKIDSNKFHKYKLINRTNHTEEVSRDKEYKEKKNESNSSNIFMTSSSFKRLKRR
jgi:hypothetical protein